MKDTYSLYHFMLTLLPFLAPIRINAKLSYFLLSLLPVTNIQGQVLHINGNISTDSLPVSYASVTFIEEGNSSNTFSTFSDISGNFQIDIINGITEAPVIPAAIELAQNYPNPFSIETEILYKLNKQGRVSLKIYDILGEEVKTLNTGLTSTGIHRLKWDGKNNFGANVTPGVYLYQLQAGNETLVKKMLYAGGNTTTYIPFPSFNNESIEKAKSPVTTNLYTCIIENSNNTNPRILTKEIKGINVDSNLTLTVLVKNESDAYFPIQLGNEWIFQFAYFDPWVGRDTIITLNYRIITTKNVNGEIYYGFNLAMPFFPDNSLINNSDPIFVRQNGKGDIMLLVDDSEYIYFSFDPSLLGSRNSTKIKDTDYVYQIESINDSVITSIGSLNNCFRILNYFPASKGREYYIWFAAGYGPVKIYYPEDGITYQLVKLTINKQ